MEYRLQSEQITIYWIYNPVQTTYLYFVVTMIVTTYIGVGLKKLHSLFENKCNITLEKSEK